MPPSHCVNWRHIESERERSSKSVTTLAPVVVRRGHALEVRVDRVVELLTADEEVGEGRERCRHQQHRRDDEEALADADVADALLR